MVVIGYYRPVSIYIGTFQVQIKSHTDGNVVRA